MKKIHYSVNLIMTATILNYNMLVRKAFMIWGSPTERTGLRGFQFLPASRVSSVFTSQITFASSSGTLCPADSRWSEGTSTHNSQHNMHIQPCNVLQKRNNKNKCIAYDTRYLDLPRKKIARILLRDILYKMEKICACVYCPRNEDFGNFLRATLYFQNDVLVYEIYYLTAVLHWLKCTYTNPLFVNVKCSKQSDAYKCTSDITNDFSV